MTELAVRVVLEYEFEPQISVSSATERSIICIVTIATTAIFLARIGGVWHVTRRSRAPSCTWVSALSRECRCDVARWRRRHLCRQPQVHQVRPRPERDPRPGTVRGGAGAASRAHAGRRLVRLAAPTGRFLGRPASIIRAMKHPLPIAAVFLLVASSLANAQTVSLRSGATVAYISGQRISTDSVAGREAQGRLAAMRQRKAAEVQSKRRALDETRQKLAGAVAGDERLQLERQEQVEQQDLERSTAQAQTRPAESAAADRARPATSGAVCSGRSPKGDGRGGRLAVRDLDCLGRPGPRFDVRGH